MKLHILSDLHLEFREPGSFPLPRVEADLCILAGDIHRGRAVIPWIAQHRPPEVPVVFVAGNHEYYGGVLPDLTETLRAEARQVPNLFFLEQNAVEWGDLVILGGTLWTDLSLAPDPEYAARLLEHRMNDFYRIRVNPGHQRLRAALLRQWHRETLTFFERQLRQHAHRPVIIVTHHAPSERSLPPESRLDPLRFGFASALEDWICRFPNLVLWVHGHTHHAVDYRICHTRVVSNPLGYPVEAGRTGFRPDFTVTL